MDYSLHETHAGILAQHAVEDDDDPNESYSWVMLNQKGDIEPLPHESIFHKTRGRIALELSAPSPSQGVPAYSQRCDRGTAYITNQRLIYLASTPTDQFTSFSTKILSSEDAHTGSTLLGFGANFWESTIKPVSNGGVPADYPRINMRLVFYDGGHSDWAIKHQDMKGRLLHAVETAGLSYQNSTNMLNMISGEQLPEYSPGEGGSVQPQTEASQVQVEVRGEEAARDRQTNQGLPDEPPPDYDEAQAQAVAARFDERAREDAERQ
ncbi:uncharacterized protein BCR38DRAFT_486965 [Pseudomassariella vexata]|uniref:Uncharacterized protein n=1 Tax=Pseudomassariella vexata TaxID=1141098 RepID=A0A1Y2DPX7_9PEZI|nr:uncharacterized protein BCR38DRAFT_486965 [Pseudomassariella vexata]ORY61204.1 hypothetical protein BCR38DRAFT_486965 [Pseudomassariella vexata]